MDTKRLLAGQHGEEVGASRAEAGAWLRLAFFHGVAVGMVVVGLAWGQDPVLKLEGLPTTGGWPVGSFVAGVGDVDGDGVPDILTAAGPERVRVYSGRTGEVLLDIHSGLSNSWFGSALAPAGDVNGDGHADFVVGAPNAAGPPSGAGRVFVFSGRDGTLLYTVVGTSGSQNLGRSVAGGLDLNGDGVPDFAAGGKDVVRAYSGLNGNQLWEASGLIGGSLVMIGDTNEGGHAEVVTGVSGGFVHLLSGKDGSTIFRLLSPNFPPYTDSFGHALARIGDLNGDGVEDFAVGAYFDSTMAGNGGRVDVFSGVDGSVLLQVYGNQFNSSLGYSVSGVGDVDGDGVPDIIAGTPTFVGIARVFSGATGSVLYNLVNPDPNNFDSGFGRSVTGLGDLNGDGLGDFAVGYHGDSSNHPNKGSVWVYLGGSSGPAVYCQSKVNSQGCTPAISSTGQLSLSIGDSFNVRASSVINEQPGLLAWSTAPASQPFHGGTLCLGPPIIRTPVQNSGGTEGGADCSGSYEFHFSQAYASQVGIQPGTTLYAQFWQRDPAHPDGTGVGLTNALTFTVYP